MLGRRHFRIKTLQTLYSYFQGGESRMDVAEQNLLRSIDKLHELYYIQISFLLEVIHFYGFRMEEARNKFYPTQEEQNPNTKLLENKLIHQLQENKNLADKFRQYKISWTEDQEMVRKVWQRLRNGKDLSEYLSSDETGYSIDRSFTGKLFRKFIAHSKELRYYCEERNLFWADDFDVAAVFILKTIKMMDEKVGNDSVLTDLFLKDGEKNMEEDLQFARDLFRKTILYSNDYEPLIEARTKNWELELIALTDIILIKMALTELIYFPEIPVKVSMNEYIEISKLFSTLKSKQFINGILDRLVSDLMEEKRIRKTGRGLMQ